eukprot:scaffold7375_cov268-Pinguiococcus_pyrenoidosus.AAC.57
MSSWSAAALLFAVTAATGACRASASERRQARSRGTAPAPSAAAQRTAAPQRGEGRNSESAPCVHTRTSR